MSALYNADQDAVPGYRYPLRAICVTLLLVMVGVLLTGAATLISSLILH